MPVTRDQQLAEVLGDYRSWLYRQARSLLPPGSPDVDDLVQEGYIAMWRALSLFDPARGALPAWLTLRAWSRMLDCVKRHVPETLSLDAPRTEAGETLADLLAAPEHLDGITLAYMRGEVAAALGRLSPAQRRYVVARFWGGMTTSEMARYVFGYDPSGLWNSKRNGARQKLAAALAHLAPEVVGA